MSTSIASVASHASVQTPPPVQQPAARPDRDGDEAAETAASKAKEAAKPVNPNLGSKLNIST